MALRELRGACWKLLVALLLIALLAPNLTSYQEIREQAKQPSVFIDEVALGSNDDTGQTIDPAVQKKFEEMRDAQEPRDPVELAAQEVRTFYLAGGFYILLPLAALLGAGLVSGEVSRSTLWLVLSRPVSRTRLLFTKYGVCAGALLMVTGVGGLLLISVAGARGYPLQRLDGADLLFTGGSVWLASLFVLGVALLASVVFRSVVVSLMATVLVVFGVVTYGTVLWEILRYFGYGASAAYGLSDRLWLPFYWLGGGISPGVSSTTMNLLVCLLAAALPLLVALGMFRRKGY